MTTPDGTTWEVPQFLDLSLSLSMREFSDSFELTLGDPDSSLVSKVYNDCTVTILFGETTVLVGQIDVKRRGQGEYADTIQLTGRSKGSEWAGSDAIPKKYKNTTDNKVIEDVFSGSGFSLDLDASVTYKDWDIGLGVRKAEAAARIAEEGGFYLWHSDTTIYKKKVPTAGSAVKTYVTPDVPGDGIPILADSIDLKTDTTKARSQIVFYASDSKHEKIKETRNITPTLKLESPERTLSLTRIQRLAIDAKDKGEAQKTADANAFRAQPIETLSFTVRGRDALALNSIVRVTVPRYAVNTDLACYEKQIKVTSRGQSTTKLLFVPLGRPLP